MDPVVDFVLGASLALLFAAAALHKLRDLPRFRGTIAAYRLVPSVLAGSAAVAVVGAEIAVATALVVPRARETGLAGAALLLAAYGGAVAVNLVRGRRDLDCGCLGAAGRETITWWLVGRNAVLASIALAGLGPVGARPLVWVDAATALGLLAIATFTWLAVDGLVANLPAVARLRRRMDGTA